MNLEKKCYKCKLFKDKASFAKNLARGDGLQSLCRECKKQKDKEYYKGHSLQMRRQIYTAKKVRMRSIQDEVFKYLLSHPCVDCGEKDIVVLEFDHQRDKDRDISGMIRSGFTWERIYKEI